MIFIFILNENRWTIDIFYIQAYQTQLTSTLNYMVFELFKQFQITSRQWINFQFRNHWHYIENSANNTEKTSSTAVCNDNGKSYGCLRWFHWTSLNRQIILHNFEFITISQHCCGLLIVVKFITKFMFSFCSINYLLIIDQNWLWRARGKILERCCSA